ncbi:hypothetical protein ACFSCW_15735 [Sphingomonas tabacisoli]|uniref:Uncharacterized protein n=1 Tax=Sphingomonas tabacisoli TaxID=2249466 RepID=A0ABW4I6W5_9SPHN
MDKAKAVEEATQRVLGLAEELESAGDATFAGDELQRLHEELHRWVDSVIAVVASPGVGRVALIHANGRQSSISSPDLPHLLSKPARFEPRAAE